jgi:hypothetical protein
MEKKASKQTNKCKILNSEKEKSPFIGRSSREYLGGMGRERGEGCGHVTGELWTCHRRVGEHLVPL